MAVNSTHTSHFTQTELAKDTAHGSYTRDRARAQTNYTLEKEALILWAKPPQTAVSNLEPPPPFGSLLVSLPKMSEIFSYTACRQLLQMLFAVIFFHISEYILALSIHGKSNVSLKSLLISKQYILAMICSIIEYLVEIYFFPGLKEYCWISNMGLAMVIFGEVIRKLAIITAGQAFTHLIKIYHEEHHKLVTHGVYGFVRHPGYTGFFIWSVGTQIMLVNPISTIAFAFVVWHFFFQRIPYEEFFLRQFFGSQYDDYARRVPSGIPFVK